MGYRRHDGTTVSILPEFESAMMLDEMAVRYNKLPSEIRDNPNILFDWDVMTIAKTIHNRPPKAMDMQDILAERERLLKEDGTS